VPWPYCDIGEILIGQEAWEDALRAFEQCEERADDEDTRSWARSGHAHTLARQAEQRGEWALAAEFFGEAISFAPYEASLFCERSEMYRRLDELEAARDDASTCLNLSDDDELSRWADELLRQLGE
jgi:tetratricopeptide (TPR) repeat protein